jgi:hypothetical protein
MQTAPHRRASAFVILHKSPVQLRLFEFTTMMFDERSAPWRLIGDVKKPCARTLSRQIWQQKNFHHHSAGVSPARAKANFPDESRPPIRTRACRRGVKFWIAMKD